MSARRSANARRNVSARSVSARRRSVNARRSVSARRNVSARSVSARRRSVSARRNALARRSVSARRRNALARSATATVDVSPVLARMESVTVLARRSAVINVPVAEVN